ncbi:MAG: DHA2 family efflux MFS transporter permease subunit [Nocardioides sp.]
MTDSATVPAEPTKQTNLGLALVLISIAQLMIVLDATISNIALPYIKADLGFTDSGLTWVVTIYALTFGGLLLLGGRLGDLYGRRKIFIVGLIVFAIASLLGGIAQDPASILAGRALQGVGGALASPAALALITTTFPAGPPRNRAMAVYAAMSGAGAAVGLILGGYLTGADLFGLEGWRMTFLINVPIGIIAAAMAPRVLRESASGEGTLDVPGAISGTAGLLSLVYGLSLAGNQDYGWDSTRTIAFLVTGVVLLAAFVVIEMRATHPLLPFRIFASQTRAASFAAMFLLPAAMFSMFFYLSLYIQNVMGYTPLKAGFAFLPFSAGIIVAAGLASNLINRVDPRYLAGVGTLMAAVALYGFSRLPYDTEFPVSEVKGDYVTDILPFIVVMSLGMGFVFVPLTLTAVHGVSSEDSGIGSGVLNTMQQVGGALGLATLATVASNVFNDRGAELQKAGEAAAQQAAQAGQPAPTPDQLDAMQRIAELQVFTEGATSSFVVGAAMMLAGSVITWIFLNVKHKELGADGAADGVHVG